MMNTFRRTSVCFLAVQLALLTVLVAMPTGAQADINDGLISYYTFDGTSGSVVDSVGSNDGTNYGAVRGVTGKVGNAFQFDGIDDYVDTLLPGDIPVESTVSVWINPTDTGTVHQIYGSVDTTSSGKDGFIVGFHPPTKSSSLDYWSSNNYSGAVVGSDNTILPDTWTHLTFTVDSSNQVSIYVNGMLDVTGSLSVSPTSHDRALMFGKGAFSGGGSFPFTGLIDDVKIWNRALSAAEVSSLVPEPSVLTLLCMGIFGLLAFARRKNR